MNLEMHKSPSPCCPLPTRHHVLHGPLAQQGSTFPRMEPIPPTGYAHLAVPEHILRVPTKIHAPMDKLLRRPVHRYERHKQRGPCLQQLRSRRIFHHANAFSCTAWTNCVAGQKIAANGTAATTVPAKHARLGNSLLHPTRTPARIGPLCNATTEVESSAGSATADRVCALAGSPSPSEIARRQQEVRHHRQIHRHRRKFAIAGSQCFHHRCTQ